MIDREVREVEEPVAHASVLPVDDAKALAVVEEVRVQEVVVARNGLRTSETLLDEARGLVRPLVLGGNGAAALESGPTVGLHDAKGVELPRDGPSVVERTQARSHPPESRELSHSLDRRNLSRDEAGHEPPLGLDELDDLGADPERGRGARGLDLDLAVDAEQVRVLTRDTEDEGLPVDLDLHVVVRDAASEDLPARLATRPDALDGGVEAAHARIRSPRGSKRGSSATSPATHSPKISTATSVPTPCSAGRYAYAIDSPTV